MRKTAIQSMAILLALTLVFSLSCPVFADDSSATEKMPGILDIFEDILETDFNPKWEMTLEELQSQYKGGVPIAESAYYMPVTILGDSFGCLCQYMKVPVNSMAFWGMIPMNDESSMDKLISHIQEKDPELYTEQESYTGTEPGNTFDAYTLMDGSVLVYGHSRNVLFVYPEDIDDPEMMTTISNIIWSGAKLGQIMAMSVK